MLCSEGYYGYFRMNIMWFFVCLAVVGVCGDRETGIAFIKSVGEASDGTSASLEVVGQEAVFLVDEKQGIFAGVCYGSPRGYEGASKVIFLETNDKKRLRAYVVGRRQGVLFLKVMPKDLPLLKNRYVFTFRAEDARMNEPLHKYAYASKENPWCPETVSDLGTWTRFSGMHVISKTKTSLEGVPAVDAKGLVVGIVYGWHGNYDNLMYSGAKALLHLEHIRKKGTLFEGHIDASFFMPELKELEERLKVPFKPSDYDQSHLSDKRVVAVAEVYINPFKESLEKPLLHPWDVLLAVDGQPIYVEVDVMRALMKAQEAGKKVVQVRVWRYGQILTMEVPMHTYATQLAQEEYRYGPCTFMEEREPYRANQTFVKVVCRKSVNGLYGERLWKINDHDAQTLLAVRRALEKVKGQELFLHLFPYKCDGYFSSDMMAGGAHRLVHIPEGKEAGSYVYRSVPEDM